MPKMSSDNKVAKEALEALYQTLVQNGSVIDEDVEFCFQEGRIHCFVGRDIKKQTQLFKIPYDLMIPHPYEKFDLEINEGVLEIVGFQEDLTDVQCKLFEHMVDIYNATGMFARHLEQSIWLKYQEVPGIVDDFLGVLNGEDIDTINRLKSQPEFWEDLAVMSFLKTRMFYSQIDPVKAEPLYLLAPVAELLNHHIAGSVFDYLYDEEADRGYMVVNAVQNLEGSQECFTSYGMFDALYLWANYHFIDQTAVFVKSVPLEIELENAGGSIIVRADNQQVPTANLPPELQEVSFYCPHYQARTKKKIIDLSHIFIPSKGGWFSMRRILAYLIYTINPGCEEPALKGMIQHAEKEILQKNEDFYVSLISKTEQVSSSNDLITSIKSISNFQLTQIKNYKDFFGLEEIS